MTQWKTVPFDRAFKDITSKGNKIPQDSFKRFGKYPIIDQGESFIAGYLDDESLAWKEDLPVVVFGDHTRILKFIDFRFVLGADGTKVLKPSIELIPKFAYYSLLHLDIPSAGYSRHFRFLKESGISFPLRDEQNRIAAILDQADRLCRQRLFAQTLSDSFLQSVFIKMFGDPVSNPMNWTQCRIEDVVSRSEYGTSEKSNNQKKGYPILGMTNLTYSGEIDLSSLSYVDLSAKEFEKLRLEKGDVVFNRTNSTELVGKVASWNSTVEAVIASYLVKLKLKNDTLPTYFVRLLNTPHYKRLFQKRCKKAVGQSNVSPTLLKEFLMMLPPLPLQEKFAEIVQKFERVRRQQREATRQAEHLFQTLLHRAFRGDL